MPAVALSLLTLTALAGAPMTPANWEAVARHSGNPVVIAHRGASAYAPENSLAAYREAVARGARIAETDVHVTLDGQLAVIHDDTTTRTTGRSGKVAEAKMSELAELDNGSWFGPQFAGERLPELGTLLDELKGKLLLCLEIKAGAGAAELVRERVDARGMRRELIVFSFDPQAITETRAALPDVPAVYLLKPRGLVVREYEPGQVAEARALGAHAVGVAYKALVSEAFVQAAHAQGLPVFVWTVNDVEVALRLRAWGVDGIISDAPDVIAAAFAASP